MTVRQVWTVFCSGRNLQRPETGVSCGAWAGKEATEDAARLLAARLGWLLTAERDLCPRHRREEQRR